MNKSRRFPFEIIIILIVLVTHVYVVVSPANSLMNWFTTDDAFYYYKVAQNIGEGYGSTFDRLGMTNGYHPLWMLICIPVFLLARVNLILPLRVIVVIMAVLHAGTGVLLYRLFKKVLTNQVAMLVSLFYVLSTTIHATTAQLGMESGINAFFVVLLLYKTAAYVEDPMEGKADLKKLLGLSVVAILALFSRLDNIFVVGLIGVWVLFRKAHVRTLLLGDFVLIAASVLGSYIIRLGLGHTYFQYSDTSYAMLVASLAFTIIALYLVGLYRNPKAYSPIQIIIRSVVAVSASAAAVSGLMLGLFYLGIFNGFPRSVLLIYLGLGIGLITVFRLLAHFISTDDTETASKALISPSQLEWKPWISRALTYFGPILLALFIYWGFNYFSFGTPMPVSGQIKRWWSTLPNTVYGYPKNTLEDFLGLDPNWDVGPWAYGTSQVKKIMEGITRLFSLGDQFDQPLMVSLEALIFVIVVLLVRANWEHARKVINRFSMLPLFAACMVHIMAYKATGYAETIRWYWVIEMIFIVLMTALVLDLIYRALMKSEKSTRLMGAVTVLLSLALLANFSGMLIKQFPQRIPEENREAYLSGARALEEHTEPGSLIGSTGGGVIGYFIQDRTIINLDGLINSHEYFQALEAYEANDYLDRVGLDYIYGNPYMITSSDPYMNIFRLRAKYIDEFVGSAFFRYMPEGWEKQYE